MYQAIILVSRRDDCICQKSRELKQFLETCTCTSVSLCMFTGRNVFREMSSPGRDCIWTIYVCTLSSFGAIQFILRLSRLSLLYLWNFCYPRLTNYFLLNLLNNLSNIVRTVAVLLQCREFHWAMALIATPRRFNHLILVSALFLLNVKLPRGCTDVSFKSSSTH